MTLDSRGLLLVLFLGAVNWVTTEIVVTSVIFKDLRDAADKLGTRIKKRYPRIGEKVCYFLKCALCVGVWIGFIEAAAFGGPLHPHGEWAAWATFLANGLLYKAPGHLLLQLNGWFHNRVELLKWQAEAAKYDADERRELAELSGAKASSGDRQQVHA